MSPYQIHGIIQLLVFLILFPSGAIVALLRDKIGPSWRRIHVTIQLTATFLFIVAISLALYLGYNRVPEKDTKLQKTHRTLGRIIAGCILLQIIWAFFGRGWVMWDTWYTIHMILSALIILGGFTNIMIAYMMMKTK